MFIPSLSRGTLSTVIRTLRLYKRNRSLKPLGSIWTHAYRKAAGKPSTFHITIALTHRCMLNCVHCYAGGRRTEGEKELSTEEVKSVLDQARSMGVLQLMFSGGEPLLREDLPELIRYARNLGFLTVVNTNGWLLDRERVAVLKEAGLTQCRVSIDAPNPEICDRLRGEEGVYERAVQGIRYMREAGVTCQILTYASKSNLEGGLDELIALGRRLGVFAIFIFFPVAVGNWDGRRDLILSWEEKKRVWRLQGLTFVHLELPSPEYECCVITKEEIYISPTGNVAPCPFTPYYEGNIREHPLLKIWENHCQHFTVRHHGGCPLNDEISCKAIQEQVREASKALSETKAS